VKHRASAQDQQFRLAFEALQIEPAAFDHAAHVRLAYVYLCEESEEPVEHALSRMKAALLAFLAYAGADPSRYHETITRAWIMAVAHFMNRSTSCTSCADLVQMHPQLLDGKIMLTHYSAELLFSPQARQQFVEPNIQSIPPP
jgi:hypothetical protein